MSLSNILKEYVIASTLKDFKFKGYYQFKFNILKSTAKWVEKEVAKKLKNPKKLTSSENLLLTANGSQYIKLHYELTEGNIKKFILRLSNHKENKQRHDNANYSVNSWNATKLQIENHLTNFVSLAIKYFNALEKRESGTELQSDEEDIINKVNRDEPLYEDTNFPDEEALMKKLLKRERGDAKPIKIDKK